jgi:hypothetical protein
MTPTCGTRPSSPQVCPHRAKRWGAASTALAAGAIALGATFFAPNAAADEPKEDPLNHDEQFGLRLGLTLPYKVNFRYDDSPPCGTRNPVEEKKVCPVGSPVALDIAASYALSGTVEPFVWFRLGLGAETETSTEAATIVGAGLRLYTRSTARLKIYLQPALAAEFEGPTVAIPGRNWETDVVAQVHLGGQYDFTRNVGAYVSLGPSVAFVRAMSLAIEGSIGAQARFP